MFGKLKNWPDAFKSLLLCLSNAKENHIGRLLKSNERNL